MHAQLEEAKQLNCVSVRDIDFINSLLPMSIQMEWNRKYNALNATDKLQPFSEYMNFLEKERGAIMRVIEPNVASRQYRRTFLADGQEIKERPTCIIHGVCSHTTEEWRSLGGRSLRETYKILREHFESDEDATDSRKVNSNCVKTVHRSHIYHSMKTSHPLTHEMHQNKKCKAASALYFQEKENLNDSKTSNVTHTCNLKN